MNPLFNGFFRERLIQTLVARFSSSEMDQLVRTLDAVPEWVVWNPSTLLLKATMIVDYFGDRGLQDQFFDAMTDARPFLVDDTLSHRRKVVDVLTACTGTYRDSLIEQLGVHPEDVMLDRENANAHAWAIVEYFHRRSLFGEVMRRLIIDGRLEIDEE